ncbi:hypothetical protein RRG08_053427 [Elysia crispata]|uniref:Choline transporter-like protein n=1 Tax=Elysia crispata TaxID=231223 RepID=A0AAE1DFY2_9GAST|nr:hypothetical protein RRG08_053427 [Elysia crispata]
MRVERGGGEPLEYDPTFKGPIRNRSCTDIICCFLFVLCLLGMIVVSIIGYAHGDPYRLVYPTDSQGDICGLGHLKDKPNLFFFDLVTCAKLGPAVVTGCPTPQVCVKECPSKNTVHMVADRSDLICLDKVDLNQSPYKEMTANELVKKNLCASYYLNSKPIVGRCVPKIFSDVIDTSTKMVDSDSNTTLERANGDGVTVKDIKEGTINLLKFFKLKGVAELLFNDVLNSLHLIAVCLLIGVILAMIWIVLLRWVTHVAVWLSIILFICLFGFATGFSFYKYIEVKNTNVTEEFQLPETFKFELDYFLSLERTWLIFGCTSGIILLLFLLIILGLCSRIILATNIIAEASVAVSHMWSVLLWPIAPFLLQFLVIAYWISSMACIASMGEKQFYNGTSDIHILLNRVPCNPEGNSTLSELCGFVKYGGDTYKTAMLIWMLFMFFWLMNFVLALEEMTLAGAFASYYWAWDKKKDIPTFPLISSFFRSLRYHTGSLAFGSLIIAFVQMIASALEYINRKLKGSENDVAKFIVKCLRCCFWCLEKFLRYINKNAYIVIAVHGRNFCSAAKHGFLLIMRNVLRAAILDKVCDFLMLISKLLITAATGAVAYFWFQREVPVVDEYVPELNYFLSPIMLVILGTYLIVDCFFDVYSMAVDTIFICFLEDIERNDGSRERPYFMTKTRNLRKFLKNKKE